MSYCERNFQTLCSDCDKRILGDDCQGNHIFTLPLNCCSFGVSLERVRAHHSESLVSHETDYLYSHILINV